MGSQTTIEGRNPNNMANEHAGLVFVLMSTSVEKGENEVTKITVDDDSEDRKREESVK